VKSLRQRQRSGRLLGAKRSLIRVSGFATCASTGY
jgi:hypothetical protein